MELEKTSDLSSKLYSEENKSSSDEDTMYAGKGKGRGKNRSGRGRGRGRQSRGRGGQSRGRGASRGRRLRKDDAEREQKLFENRKDRLKIAAESKNKGLRPWLQDIINHFWYSCRTCDGSSILLAAKLRGLLHHVVNSHSWISGDGCGPAECEHGNISDERNKDWLIPDSDEHRALRKVLLDVRFQRNLKYYVNFRHTGELESFHNLILMYASKRFSYSYPVYKTRNYLAAIDFEKHKGRKPKLEQKGNQMYRRNYSKRSKTWSVATNGGEQILQNLRGIHISALTAAKWKVGKVNHVAIACSDLDKATVLYRDILGAKVSEKKPQPDHGVYTVFVELGDTKIEMLQPLGDESPIKGFLDKNKNGGMHHICIEVDNIEAAMADLKARNIRLLSEKARIGAHGKPVVFVHPKDCNGVLLELEEA